MKMYLVYGAIIFALGLELGMLTIMYEGTAYKSYFDFMLVCLFLGYIGFSGFMVGYSARGDMHETEEAKEESVCGV